MKEINLYNTYHLAKRKKIKDVTLIISLCTEEPECLEKVKVTVKYLHKNVLCNIIIICKNIELAKQGIGLADENIVYTSCRNRDFGSFIMQTVAGVTTTNFGLLPQNLILPIKVLKRTFSKLKGNETVIISKVLTTDKLMQSIFARSYDINFLAENEGKLTASKEPLTSLFTSTNHPALHQLLDTYLNQKPFAGHSGIHFFNETVYAIG